MGYPQGQGGSEMNTFHSRAIYRKWCWLLVLPLIFGASVAFLKYAGWSAVYSGNYGLPSRAWLVKEASLKGHQYLWLFAALTSAATAVAAIVSSPFESEDLPRWFRWIFRFAVAGGLVLVSIFVVAVGLSIVERYLR
jgi:hypothetical protein